jgi:hypothetical protein
MDENFQGDSNNPKQVHTDKTIKCGTLGLRYLFHASSCQIQIFE